MMAVQYIDYPADNNKLSWADMMVWLRQRRWQSLSFGAVTYAALLVPVLNLLIMPAAVAGATLFWVGKAGRIGSWTESIDVRRLARRSRSSAARCESSSLVRTTSPC